VIHLLVYILIAALVMGLIYYVITLIPLPAPFATIVRVVFLIICILVIVNAFLPFLGTGTQGMRY
jgi:hypothetical protein